MESGIRRDQGLLDAAVVALQGPELTGQRIRPEHARLYYAYADALLQADREDEAREWFGRAASADVDDETDAAERYEDLDDFSFDDFDDLDSDEVDDEDDDSDEDEDANDEKVSNDVEAEEDR